MNQVPSPQSLRVPEISPERTVTRQLLAALEAEGVSYCHWKSNCRLVETLAGEEDIDVLVDRRQEDLFLRVALRLGFKPAVSDSGTDHPSTYHLIGLDRDSGEVVDLHVCHQVYTGDSYVKTYRLALEEPLLRNTTYHLGVRVPQPALELAFFVLRMGLKHLSVIEIVKSNRKYAKNADELAWLRRNASDAEAAALCQEHFPGVRPDLFLALAQAVADPSKLVQRIVLGWRVGRRLRHLKRLGPLRAAVSRLWRFLSFLKSRLLQRKAATVQSGGMIVALVGPKATGKSTLANALAQRLGRHLKVVRIHAGKPPATLLSCFPRLFVPLARKLLPGERLSVYEEPERRERRRYSLFYVLRMTLLAYDRQRLLRRALRQAAAGAIVVSDRFPSQRPGAIDSSCFDDQALARCTSRLQRWLMDKERSLYARMPQPDLVLKLEAPMQLALARDATRQKQGGPDAAAVLRRWELETADVFPDSRVVRIDTAAPLSETARQAVIAVWQEA